MIHDINCEVRVVQWSVSWTLGPTAWVQVLAGARRFTHIVSSSRIGQPVSCRVGVGDINFPRTRLPYLPVYNAGPCIIRIPISDQILRKKKNKLLNKKVKLYNIIYFN